MNQDQSNHYQIVVRTKHHSFSFLNQINGEGLFEDGRFLLRKLKNIMSAEGEQRKAVNASSVLALAVEVRQGCWSRYGVGDVGGGGWCGKGHGSSPGYVIPVYDQGREAHVDTKDYRNEYCVSFYMELFF
ncbi:hypothetical protein C5167_026308 [Papaver somniferum]|nr:hypothetical protein C5167_026308 [Papaver somniferum]